MGFKGSKVQILSSRPAHERELPQGNQRKLVPFSHCIPPKNAFASVSPTPLFTPPQLLFLSCSLSHVSGFSNAFSIAPTMFPLDSPIFLQAQKGFPPGSRTFPVRNAAATNSQRPPLEPKHSGSCRALREATLQSVP